MRAPPSKCELLSCCAHIWLTGIAVNAPGQVPRGVAHFSRMP